MEVGGAEQAAAGRQPHHKKLRCYDYINPANRLMQWGSMALGILVVAAAVGLFVPYLVKKHGHTGLKLSKVSLVMIPLGVGLCLFSWLCIFVSKKLGAGSRVVHQPQDHNQPQ